LALEAQGKGKEEITGHEKEERERGKSSNREERKASPSDFGSAEVCPLLMTMVTTG